MLRLHAPQTGSLDDGCPTVSLGETPSKPHLGPIAPKSQKGKRVVPVAGELRRYPLAHKPATGRDGDELLFGRTARTPFTPTHVRKRAREAWAAAAVGAFLRGESFDLEPIGLHECHSSTYMVGRYRHLIDGQRRHCGRAPLGTARNVSPQRPALPQTAPAAAVSSPLRLSSKLRLSRRPVAVRCS